MPPENPAFLQIPAWVTGVLVDLSIDPATGGMGGAYVWMGAHPHTHKSFEMYGWKNSDFHPHIQVLMRNGIAYVKKKFRLRRPHGRFLLYFLGISCLSVAILSMGVFQICAAAPLQQR